MLLFLFNVIKIIIMLGLLVFIHEGGHFIIAKIKNVKVNDFAIGFGPILWKKTKGDTTYSIRLIPLGGFVNLEGEDLETDDLRSFKKAPLKNRIAIILAGGIVNIVFALILYFILISFSGSYITNKVTNIYEDYPISQTSLKVGDEIVSINNRKTILKEDIDKAMKDSNGKTIVVKIKRNSEILKFETESKELEIKEMGLYLKLGKDGATTEIEELIPGGASEESGLKAKDVIIKINDIELFGDATKISETLNSSNQEDVKMLVKRDEEELEFIVKPNTYKKYLLGVELSGKRDNFFENTYYSLNQTKNFSFSIVENLKNLFTKNMQISSFSGPVGISKVISNTNGLYEFLYLFALLSLSLGVMNLLPILPLDGGKFVLLIVEGIRRKPIKENIEIVLSLIGFAAIITLSIVVTYNDIIKIF